MATISEKIIPVDFEDEMNGRRMDCSMSVMIHNNTPKI